MSPLILLPAVLLIFAAFVILGRRHEETPRLEAPEQDDGIDRAELERAEREVQEMEHDGSGAPPEQAPGDDWGPGVPRGPVA